MGEEIITPANIEENILTNASNDLKKKKEKKKVCAISRKDRNTSV